MTERVFVALGANLGDRRAQLDEAVRRIGELEGTTVLAVAPVLETTALLPHEASTPQPDYLNTVAELRTTLEPLPLLRALKAIERAMGRLTTTRWAPRVIDLDLVLFGDRLLVSEELTLPHQGLSARRFVLEPLLALWPEAIDPRTGRSLRA
ncbi:MAG: 2-amino-4-hydroxy-6-hydroxymethyldihydropteridine diphosphokinase [Myxococcales bacterium]|nr:2-amino-4-hydroxy-6-hydroxymethyldihydropteridine diphosphokinase [Myxococcales bacterium]MDP3500125.1 2-amino-4-hydroxy-6-hydroxymethyldihydropteridine diphosphokinase [Myxococcales bacterium]